MSVGGADELARFAVQLERVVVHGRYLRKAAAGPVGAPPVERGPHRHRGRGRRGTAVDSGDESHLRRRFVSIPAKRAGLSRAANYRGVPARIVLETFERARSGVG